MLRNKYVHHPVLEHLKILVEVVESYYPASGKRMAAEVIPDEVDSGIEHHHETDAGMLGEESFENRIDRVLVRGVDEDVVDTAGREMVGYLVVEARTSADCRIGLP